MPITRAVANQIDAEAATMIAALIQRQRSLLSEDPNFRGHPRFVQLPETHDVPPAILSVPDTSRRLPHRSIGWPEIKARGYTPPLLLRASFAVQEYQSPSRAIPWGAVAYTPGWFVVARASDGGTVYRKQYDGAGPETFETTWAEEPTS